MMKNREDETEEGKCGSDMRKVEEKATHPDTGKQSKMKKKKGGGIQKENQ